MRLKEDAPHRTHHVLDLREGDLQGDVQSAVRVSYRPQGAGIILHQIVQELLGVAALRRVNHYRQKDGRFLRSNSSVMITHKPHLQEAASLSR